VGVPHLKSVGGYRPLDTYEVTDVTTTRAPSGQEHWQVTCSPSAAGQPVRVHLFPKATLDYRAAEYGIDPADVGTLLDVVLHEPFIPDPTDPANHAGDAAAKKGHQVRARQDAGRVRKGDLVPAWLYNADDIDQARAAHLERIGDVKQRIAAIKPPKNGPDPLDVIRGAYVPDPARIAGHRGHVQATRRALRGEKTPIPRRPPERNIP
jgi:hypothetical protein